jgi:hypothetical protein
MARSNVVWVAVHTSQVLATFTVKHELISWLTTYIRTWGHALSYEDFVIYRMNDGPPTLNTEQWTLREFVHSNNITVTLPPPRKESSVGMYELRRMYDG